MSSVQLLVTLVSGLLGWFQWYPPQSTADGIHGSASAQRSSAGGPQESAGQATAKEGSERPKREFVIFDTTLYKEKPDLSRYGLRPLSAVYKYMLWPVGSDDAVLPDRDLVRKVAAQAATSTGIAVVDVEHWPLAGDPAVVEESVRKYGTLIRWFKEAAPSLIVGYYGVAPQRNYWDALQPIASPRYVAWQNSNDRVASITQTADILFPSVYTFNDDQSRWSKYAIQQIEEARRYRGGKPVYVFLWPQYHFSDKKFAGKYLPPEYWRMELDTARKYADGAVIWGGYQETWDEAAPWWLETKMFLQRIGAEGR